MGLAGKIAPYVITFQMEKLLLVMPLYIVSSNIMNDLQSFPEGMLHLTNMTHLTLTCQYGVTQLPVGISKLNKLEVYFIFLFSCPDFWTSSIV